MTQTDDTKTLIVEREMPHSLEKIWRALTQGSLIEEWLMKNDFKPVVGHRFDLRADWGVVKCQVLAVEPNKVLSYAWEALGLKSVVTWTLAPTSTGTHLRMEQSGLAGTAAGLRGRKIRLAEILRRARTRGGRPVVS